MTRHVLVVLLLTTGPLSVVYILWVAWRALRGGASIIEGLHKDGVDWPPTSTKKEDDPL